VLPGFMILNSPAHAAIDKPPANCSWVVNHGKFEPGGFSRFQVKPCSPTVYVVLLLAFERDEQERSVAGKSLGQHDSAPGEVF